MLDDSGVDFQIPSFFYAIEEDRYFDPINIFTPGGTRTEDLDTLCGWTKQTEKGRGGKPKINVANWASMRLTFVQEFMAMKMQPL